MKKMINTEGALNTIAYYTDTKEPYARYVKIQEALWQLLLAEMISQEAYAKMNNEIAHHTQTIIQRNQKNALESK